MGTGNSLPENQNLHLNKIQEQRILNPSRTNSEPMQETNRESRAHAGNNKIFQSPCTKQSENQKPLQQAITYNPSPSRKQSHNPESKHEVREKVEGQQFTRGLENTNMTECISSRKDDI
jgi:hypothetical protein